MGKDVEKFYGDDGKVLIVERHPDDSSRNQIDVYIKDTGDSVDSNKGHFWVGKDGEAGSRDIKPSADEASDSESSQEEGGSGK